jgi:hypothetical protein
VNGEATPSETQLMSFALIFTHGLDSPDPCPVVTLQHDGINIPDEHGEENDNKPGILVLEIEPCHDNQANDKTAQVHDFIEPGTRFPFDCRIEISYDPEARIGTPSPSIPVIAFRGKSLEPADAQAFVASAVTLECPQIEIVSVAHRVVN